MSVATSRGPMPEGPEVTLIDLLRLLRSYLRLLVGLPLLLGVAFALWSMSQPRTYSASAAFAAHGGAAAGLTGLAAQLGLGGVAAGSTEGPAYFAEVSRSTAVLGAIAESSFTVTRDAQQVRRSVAELLGTTDADPERQRGLTAEALRAMVDAKPTVSTGIVRVVVTADDPQLATEIARQLMAQVSDFNLAQRQRQAAREREFAQQQLESARQEANGAEAALASFLQRNRQYQNSPTLTAEYGRLQRIVNQRQGVVSSLMQAVDQARLEEVRNVPRISILEPATPPLRGNSRGTPGRAAAGLLLGVVLAAGFALGREYLRASGVLPPARAG